MAARRLVCGLHCFLPECKQIVTLMRQYIFKAFMLLLSSNRVKTQSPAPKPTQDEREEHDNQFDLHQFRCLLSIFAQNLNLTLKTHKDCLGEVQYYPNCKASRDRKEESSSQVTEIFRRMKPRLVREGLNRNIAIKRTRQNYAEQYRKAFPSYQQDHPLPKHQNLPSTAALRKVPLSENDKYRTLSLKNERRSTTGSFVQKMSIQLQTFMTIQADLPINLALKTISSDQPATKEPFLRSARSVVSRNERERRKSEAQSTKNRRKLSIQPQSNTVEDFIFTGNEILISDNRRTGHRRQYFKEAITSRVCTKQVVAMQQPQRKIINAIQALHLHTKNVDFGHSLWTHPQDLYTYKPQIKRWQRSFN